MALVPIAELSPELSEVATRQFRAVVTLVWPYSSVTRQCAFLLAAQDFRLRRKRGQVRVRFSSTSARTIAESGIGIGDEVLLSLRGAQFLDNDNSVSTPGRGIDWELSYSQTLQVDIFRDGALLASLDITDAAPTPAPASPVRQQSLAPSHVRPSLSHRGSHAWSSPAFLKRARLSDGPFFQPTEDPLRDAGDEPDKKRRRKSYKDWRVWTVAGRTPEPEEEDVVVGHEDTHMQSSPSRPPPELLPRTPVSPLKKTQDTVSTTLENDKATSEAAQPVESVALFADPQTVKHTSSPAPADDFVRDADYYDLYAGPDETPPIDMMDGASGDVGHITAITTKTTLESRPDGGSANRADEDQVAKTNVVGMKPSVAASAERLPSDDHQLHEESHESRGIQIIVQESPVPRDDTSGTTMQPPGLPLLQTSFSTTVTPGQLTPIGKEPSSPVIKPLDSATLPFPSPFPSDSNSGAHFPFERAGQNAPALTDGDDTDIMESSFYSSTNSMNASSFQPTHESAFTDVRFTFGMDGSGFSRLQVPEEVPASEGLPSPVSKLPEPVPEVDASHMDGEPIAHEQTLEVGEQSMAESLQTSPHRARVDQVAVLQTTSDTPDETGPAAPTSERSEVITLSPDIEAGSDSEVDKAPKSSIEELEPPGAHQASHPETSWTTEPKKSSLAMHEDTSAVQVHPAPSGVIDDGLSPSSGSLVQAEGHSQSAETAMQLAAKVIDLSSPSDAVSGIATGLAAEEYQRDAHSGTFNTQHESDRHEDPVISETPARSIIVDDVTHLSAPNLDFPVGQEDNLQKDITEAHADVAGASIDVPWSSWISEDEQMTNQDDDILMHDLGAFQSNEMEWLASQDQEADVKLESIEEDAPFDIEHIPTQAETDDRDFLPIDPIFDSDWTARNEATEPEVSMSQPLDMTGPARNTRSKKKTSFSISPSKSEAAPPQRVTRSMRSKASATPAPRATISPVSTRKRSTVSPALSSPVSHYSLRSQSKKLSPVDTTFAVPKLEPKSARRKRSGKQKSTDMSVTSDDESSQPPMSRFEPTASPRLGPFEPSQELGDVFDPSLSQRSRFSEVTIVGDSEEGTSHSENSLSTVLISDDFNDFGVQLPTSISPEVTPVPEDFRTNDRASSPTALSAAQPTPSMRIAEQDYEQPTTELQDSQPPHLVLSSPSRVQQPRDSSKSSEAGQSKEQAGFATPRPGTAVDTDNNDESPSRTRGEHIDAGSSPLEVKRNPDTAGDSSLLGGTQQQNDQQQYGDESEKHQDSITNGHIPLTPNATQETFSQPQQNVASTQGQKTLPMTPRLTQTTPSGLTAKSHTEPTSKVLTTELGLEEDSQLPDVERASTVIKKDTPRRNVTSTDIASQPASPSVHSEDLSDSDLEAGHSAAIKPPSIGLTTPLSYYTPLKDLPYHLNRSSQFSGPTNPDILALVTTATSAPKKAEKGPRHWTTTLSITDASTFPFATHVSIFRAYQSALPVAETGDIILLRGFAVKSLNRRPAMLSCDESAWCVWRYGKPIWGRKSGEGEWAEVKAREEVKGPVVERGVGEWEEVNRLREWWEGSVKKKLQENKDEVAEEVEEEGWGTSASQRVTRSKGKGRA